MAGCATRLPEPFAEPPNGEFPPGLVVAVSSSNQSAPAERQYDAQRVIEALRLSGLFSQVDFADALENKFDLSIQAVPDEFSNLQTNEMMLASMFTLGVFPAYGDSSNSLEFHTLCGSRRAFEFEYYTTEFGGWLSLFALPFPRWIWGVSDRRQEHLGEQVAAYLRSRAAEISAAYLECGTGR